jgi:hypothetical protein
LGSKILVMGAYFVKTCNSCPIAASARQLPWTAKIGRP